MYLKSALNLAIPLAILDREDMEQACGYEGPEAQAAAQAVIDLRKLGRVSPANFTRAERELARMCLLWGEQYLEGYIESHQGRDVAATNKAIKEKAQIRAVRLEHFGTTTGEQWCANATAVEVGGKGSDALFEIIPLVVCTGCGARTNMRSVGDSCLMCKRGVFAKPSQGDTQDGTTNVQA